MKLMDESAIGTIQPFDIIDGFRIIKRIGQGGFGEIYFVRDNAKNIPYAMKVAFSNKQKIFMDIEYSVMKEIQDSVCFPKLVCNGENKGSSYIVMELLGNSLSQIRKAQPGKRLGICPVVKTGIKTISILQSFHNHGFIHRDIKPNNFLHRPKSDSDICLIDFGLSKRHIDPNTGKPHIQSPRSCFVGTLRYASLNAHYQKDLGRCDDLYSWFLSLIELSHGTLPWSNSTDKNEVSSMKELLSTQKLCEDLPSQFLEIYEYIIGLRYHDEPNYSYISSKLVETLIELRPGDVDDIWEGIPKVISPVPSPKRRISDTFDADEPMSLSQESLSPPQKYEPKIIEHYLLNDEEEEAERCKCPCCNI